MKINWFPGHMTKALRQMQDEVKNIDVIIYILDSRAPNSSLNPEFCKLIGNKPILYILNKVDLADDIKTKNWQKFFDSESTKVLCLSSIKSGIKNEVIKKINELAKAKVSKYKAKGLKASLRAMVIGIPNSGKSTFINNLCGKSKAITGNKPGVTRGKQWLTLSDSLEVLDTPGTLWPSFIDQKVARNLAYIGSIKSEVLDEQELALSFLHDVFKMYPKLIKERFNIDCVEGDILEKIAIDRHFVVKGGEPDYLRVSKAILDDFRKGRIGKITLEEVKSV